MKQFNLDEYLKNPNQRLITRDGRKVKRVLCTDVKSEYPIVVVIENYDGTEQANTFTKDGKHLNVDGCPHKNDLFFAQEKHEGWINLYKNEDGISWISPNYFTSKKEAEEEGKTYTCSVTTIKIEWEE